MTAIYTLRAVAITIFVLAPLTPFSVYLFASVIGVLERSAVGVAAARVVIPVRVGAVRTAFERGREMQWLAHCAGG